MEDTKASILIFGASRAQQQYNPVYFEDGLKQTCYNVGRDGESIFYHYAVLKGILKRHSPQIIILDIENELFRKQQYSYDRLSVFLPFYKNHQEIRSIIDLRGPYEKIKLQSKIYPFNSILFKIAMGNTAYNEKRITDIKGYVPSEGELAEEIRFVDFSKKYEIDSNKVIMFKSFIKDCKIANVKLYLVCSPYFCQITTPNSSMILAKEIAKENGVEFFDFSKDKSFINNNKLFFDLIHVNVEGSKIFSNKLIDSMIVKGITYTEKYRIIALIVSSGIKKNYNNYKNNFVIQHIHFEK